MKRRLSRFDIRVLFRTQHAKDIIVFVDGFAIISPFLLIPPVAVRVSKLPILSRRVDVAAVLGRGENEESVSHEKVWFKWALGGGDGEG